MPKRRDLSKEELIAAMAKTDSVRAVSRYLGCSYWLVRKWMKFYKDDVTGLSLNTIHSNKRGLGIQKGWTYYHMKNNTLKNKIILADIVDGRIDISNFTMDMIKRKFINEGYLIEKCYECGFCDHRPTDNKIPLVFHFKDNNKKNWRPENITLLCYNCYFIHGYEIFGRKTLKEMESFEFDSVEIDKAKKTFELDDHHLEQLKKLGLNDDKEDDGMDGYDIVSRKK